MIGLVFSLFLLQASVPLTDCVRSAMEQTHDGWSSDEVLIRDEQRQALLATVREQIPDVPSRDVFAALLRLRKAGKLSVKATRRPPPIDPAALSAGEIAARVVLDRYDANFDDLLIDDNLLKAFDEEALRVVPLVSPYEARRAALRLRKLRQLKPELVLRVVDWQRSVDVYALETLQNDLTSIPELPGIYLFRDASGYLYIGEAENLRLRLRQHLTLSDRPTLAEYLRTHSGHPVSVEVHSFPAGSPASDLRMRRAYESELIASRKPRLNVRP